MVVNFMCYVITAVIVLRATQSRVTHALKNGFYNCIQFGNCGNIMKDTFTLYLTL